MSSGLPSSPSYFYSYFSSHFLQFNKKSQLFLLPSSFPCFFAHSPPPLTRSLALVIECHYDDDSLGPPLRSSQRLSEGAGKAVWQRS